MSKLHVYRTKDMGMAAVVLIVLLACVAWFVVGLENDSRNKLQERFVDRTSGGATFVGVYMDEMLDRESRLARRYLAGDVTPARMRLITESFDSAASVLLDANGALLAAYPHDPSLLGTDVGHKYPHLSTALTGEPAISPVVLSAVEAIPVVGAAAPFETPRGRRVFSAALSISDTPLAQYLETMLPIADAGAYLIDASGAEVIATGATHLSSLAAGPDSLTTTVDGRESFVTSEPVPGTPWTLVGTVPTASLYAPFEASRGGAWIVVALLAVSGTFSLHLFGRYTAARHDYRRRADHCPLTGLANRHLLSDHAAREMAQLDRRAGSVGLLYIDVDDFKSINDSLGHDAGDELLVEIASRLRKSVRSYDVPARLGGDEFAVLLPQVTTHELDELAARALFALKQPYELAGVRRSVGVSIGATATRSVTHLEDLLGLADAAMYQAKADGKGRYRLAGSDGATGLAMVGSA